MVSVNSNTHADDLELKAIVTTSKGLPVELKVRDDAKKSENHLASKSAFRDYTRLLGYATTSERALQLAGTLVAIGAGTVNPLMAIIFGRLVNDFNGLNPITQGQLQKIINKNALWFVWLFVAKMVLVYFHTVIFSITAVRITRKVRLLYMQAMIRQELAFFDSQTEGSAVTDISNNGNLIQDGLAEGTGVLIQALATLATALVIAGTRSWQLMLATSTSIVVLFISNAVTLSLDAKVESGILRIHKYASSLAEESLSSICNVLALGAERRLVIKYKQYLDLAKHLGLRRSPIIGVRYMIDDFIMLAAHALAFWYGTDLVLKGTISSGENVVTVILCINIAANAMLKVRPSLDGFAKSSAAAGSVLEMIDRKLKLDPTSNEGLIPNSVSGNIEIRDLSFAYPSRPNTNVLNRLNITLAAGKTTAILGSSGSGKSTIVNLIERWYDQSEGIITLDGTDIRQLNTKWLRNQIGLVSQDPVLFNDTIYQNVLNGIYGTDLTSLPKSEREQLVHDACKEANIHDFIQSLPQGYNTMLGERASRISGGQKQKIAIARAIVMKPKLLLLDEATSALDSKSERLVQVALTKISKNRTTLVIAHKLATIQEADQIVLLQKGEVFESGTHQSLMTKNGLYANLSRMQDLAPDAEADWYQNDETGDVKALGVTADVEADVHVESPIQEDLPLKRLSLITCMTRVVREHPRLWAWLLVGAFACIAGGAVYPGQAIIFGNVVSAYAFTGDVLKQKGSFWSLMFLVLALGNMVVYWILGSFFTYFGTIFSHTYYLKYFSAMLKQDVSFFDIDNHSSGALTARLTADTTSLQSLMSTTIGLVLVILTNVFSTSTLGLVVAWKLALVSLFGSLPPLVLAGFFRVKLASESSKRNSSPYDETARFVAEAVGAIRTISSLTLENEIVHRYDERLRIPVQNSYQHLPKIMLLFAFSDSISLLGQGLAFWYGGSLIVKGQLSSAQFFLVYLAVIGGGRAAGELFAHTNSFVRASAAMNRIFALCSHTSAMNHNTGILEPSLDSHLLIELKDLYFQYPQRSQVPVLQGLSLRVQRGQNIAIVGPSGSGKSTIINILERFYDPTSGSVLIGGKPLPAYNLQAYRARLALVSQETTLYEGTIQENILLGTDLDPTVVSSTDPTSALVHACEAANLHTFILSLPLGYSTPLGARGLALSGGQRQRLAIARALIRDPAILLLDEATSALDTESERLVQDALVKASRGRTTIAVAHRLSTVRRADRIFVLEGGVVVEEGRHEELIAKGGSYAEMCRLQRADLDE